MLPVTQRQSPTCVNMDPIFMNWSLWPNSAGVVGSLAAWYDSSNTASMLDSGGNPITAGGKVATWKDISGNSPAGERDLLQGTAANRPIYLPWSGSNYGWLNAVGGNKFSTPDAAANRLTTELDMVVRVAFADPTVTSKDIFGKYASAVNKRAYLIGTSGTANRPILYVSDNGTVASSITSNADWPFAAGVIGWLRATWRASDKRVQFFYAADTGSNALPSAWTQIGTDVTMPGAVASLYNSDQALLVGGKTDSGTEIAGNFYYAEIRATIDGAAAQKFDASIYTSGSTFTAATGEVWTVNGGAHIVTRTGLYFDGSNDYLKSAVFSLSQPESVYYVGAQIIWTDNEKLLDGNSGTERGAITQKFGGASPQLNLYAGTDLGPNSNLPLKTSGVVIGVFNGASSVLRVNRTAALTGSGGTNNMNGLIVGAAHDGTGPANAFVSELAIYSVAHASVTQDRLALGFSRKWRFVV